MRSLIVTGQGQITVETAPDPVLTGPDGVIVAVSTAAVCGSDMHFYDGDLPYFPVALGHEAVGTVVEAGADVRSVAVGDRVLVSSVAGCGACSGCATGDPVRCVAGPQVFGSGMLGGAQSELLAVPAADFNVLAVPDGLDDDAALLLTDNLNTGWAAAQRADFDPGADVVVLGLGAVGLCAVKSALMLGAGRVFVADPQAGRVDRAVGFGATALTRPTVEAVLEATGGRGADAVIDAVAVDGSVNDAFGSVRSGGTVSVVGVHGMEPYPLDLLMGVFRSITLRMTTAPVQATWPQLVPLLQAGRLDPSGIFTHSFDLEDGAAAYAAVADRSAETVKVRLHPGSSGTSTP
ncbi:alcohol dehydrogenase catalytic domain-containing protein [Nocardioides sp. Kera G14]|uniref:alcohol dehydrogenase catalytic domain-containing protein n=1 Tax=Nocardioides sp. Kera G14 TaxID=2884264 RepID=UPI001D113DE6|nr:alcohol dehydrogenase catalytic domain-containing protein [Nocardioides sp. Kera G14]UDY25012.1 alcohol dehydrogenase catalytic domain-containing protein [Nocardioides sp. Kera G14]